MPGFVPRPILRLTLAQSVLIIQGAAGISDRPRGSPRAVDRGELRMEGATDGQRDLAVAVFVGVAQSFCAAIAVRVTGPIDCAVQVVARNRRRVDVLYLLNNPRFLS